MAGGFIRGPRFPHAGLHQGINSAGSLKLASSDDPSHKGLHTNDRCASLSCGDACKMFSFSRAMFHVGIVVAW